MTPAEKAGIKLDLGENKIESLIKLASKPRHWYIGNNIQACLSELNEVGIIIAIITAIGLIVTIIIHTLQLRGQKNQLFIANFAEMTSHIGDEVTKEYRRWLFYDEDKKVLFEKFRKEYGLDYAKKSNEEKSQYAEIEKAIWHLASRYDRLGVILSQDQKIREKVLDYHGQVISRLWIMLEPIINTRENIEKDGAYKYFRKIGSEAIGNKYSSQKNESSKRRDRYLIIIVVVAGAYVTIFYDIFKEIITPTSTEQSILVGKMLAGVIAIGIGLIAVCALAWKKIWPFLNPES